MTNLPRRAVLAGLGGLVPPLILAPAGRAEEIPKRRPFFSVREFGALGDGITDDSGAVIQAIEALPEGGGTVHFPAGTYQISSSDGIRVTKPGTWLVGDGKQSTIRYSPHPGSAILLEVSTSNVLLENLAFDGNSESALPNIPTMVSLSDTSDTTIRNCSFYNISGSAITLINSSRVWIAGNRIENCGYSGIYLGRRLTPGALNEDIWLVDNYLEMCQTSQVAGHGAIQVRASGSHHNINVLNNTIVNPGKVGLGLDNIQKSNAVGNIVTKNVQNGSFGECIAFGGSDNLVARNYCTNNNTTSAACILLYALSPDQIQCDRNQILNNRCTEGAEGIAIVWAEPNTTINNLLVQGNTCYSNGFGIRSFLNTGVTNGRQSGIVVVNNTLVGNRRSLSLANELEGVSGGPTLQFGNILENLDESPRTDPFGSRVSVPVAVSSPGVPGQWATDGESFYLCTASDTWMRGSITQW